MQLYAYPVIYKSAYLLFEMLGAACLGMPSSSLKALPLLSVAEILKVEKEACKADPAMRAWWLLSPFFGEWMLKKNHQVERCVTQ